MHGNLHDLIVASKGFDILLCSETLVSNFRHIAELSIPSFKRPILLKRNEINRAQGMAVYIRSGCSASHKASFECGCHETQIIKVCGKHNNFYLVSVYRNPDAADGIFDCLLVSMAAIQHAVPDISFSHKIYLKSQADWDGILSDLRELDWPDIYRQVDFVASMNDGFERIIVRRIPSRVIKFRINDKAWFNEDCKRANLAKQEAYQLWRGNRSDITWNNYVNLRNTAQETYAAAEKRK